MQVNDEPYRTPDDEGAAERAKELCRSRGLTPQDVKITRKDGFVRVIVIRDGVRIEV